MQANLFKAVIGLILSIGGAIIMLLWINKTNSMEKELDQFRAADTTMVSVSDTIPQQFILTE